MHGFEAILLVSMMPWWVAAMWNLLWTTLDGILGLLRSANHPKQLSGRFAPPMEHVQTLYDALETSIALHPQVTPSQP